MSLKETEKRVKELMKELGLDTKNEMLFISLNIFYHTAQTDYIKKRLEELNEKN